MKKMSIIELRPRGASRIGPAEHLQRQRALVDAKAAPKKQQGQFVGVINELAEQWAAWRNLSAQNPVHRHLKVVSNRDGGNDSAPVSARLDAGEGASGDSYDVGQLDLCKPGLKP